jgi:hypothetical protein
MTDDGIDDLGLVVVIFGIAVLLAVVAYLVTVIGSVI